MKRTSRLALAAIVSLLAAACIEAREQRHLLRVDRLPDRHLAVAVFDDGSFDLRNAATGVLLWRDVGGAADDIGFGSHPPEAVVCPVQGLDRRRLLVVRPNSIEVVREREGRRVFKMRRRRAGRPPVCPAAAPDGTFVDAVPAFHGSGELVKYDAGGGVVWRHDNPDIGPLTAPLQVDPSTGDIVAGSDTHVLVVSPSGQTNWVREHSRP